jgi:hypothetical protein
MVKRALSVEKIAPVFETEVKMHKKTHTEYVGNPTDPNLHNNYLDMDIDKHKRAEDRRKRILARWDFAKDKAIDHTKFVKEIEGGKRLSLHEIKSLNNKRWEDYKDEIFKQDNVYTKYVKNILD